MSVEREGLLDLVRREFAAGNNTWLGRRKFLERTGLKATDIFRFFPRWSDAIAAAGIDIRPYNQKIPRDDLLEDWADLARRLGRIPTRNEYKFQGSYSAGVFESNFGPWSKIPAAFRELAGDNADWSDVLALLPPEAVEPVRSMPAPVAATDRVFPRVAQLSDRPVLW